MKIFEGITYELTENEINTLKSTYDIIEALGEELNGHIAVSYHDVISPLENVLFGINIILDLDSGEFSNEREYKV